MSAPPFGEALIGIEARLEEVLLLQRQLERNVSELVSSQSETHSAIVDLGRSYDKAVPAEPWLSLDEAQERKPIESMHAKTSAKSFASSIGDVEGRASVKSSASCMGDVRLSAESLLTGIKSFADDPELRMTTCRNSSMTDIVMVDGLDVDGEVDKDIIDERFELLIGGERLSNSIRVARIPSLYEAGAESKYILDPHCKVRATHDLLSIVVLAVDVVCAPVILAWDLGIEGFFWWFNIFSLCFWSVDTFMSFITGFYVHGELEARPRVVAKKYLKSWFAPDVVIILADMVTICLQDDSRDAGSGAYRLTKMSRFLRLLRLFRIARVSEAFSRLAELSVYVEITVETLKPLIAIILVNHFLACAWWAISKNLPSDTGRRWVNEQVGSSDVSYLQTTWPMQYLTCLHWSLSQQTPGSMQVVPLNSIERAFNCFCLLLGMLLFTSLISTISAKIMQHYLKQKDCSTKLVALRRYLSNKVQPGLVLAALFHAKRAMSTNSGRPVTVKDVAAMNLLPQALNRKILVELCAQHCRHPLLRWWFVTDPQGAQALCCNAIDFIGLAAENHLFFPRTEASGAYVMISGSALYIQRSETRGTKEETELRHGLFFCEAALWCKWKHKGELTATAGCELLSISTDGLFKCLELDFVVKHVVTQYGRQFSMTLMSPFQPQGEAPNDIFVAFTEFDSIVLSLPADCRKLIGAVAVNLIKTRWGRRAAIDSTVAELRDGECCLLLNWEGEVERIVSIITLRLLREDGKVLMQLGKWNGVSVQACCKLPGKRREEGENQEQTLERLLSGKLAPFAQHVVRTDAELEVMWKMSKSTQMNTKYLRTVNHAELSCPMESQALSAVQLWTPVTNHARGSVFVDTTSWHSAASHPHGNEFDFAANDFYALANEEGDIVVVGWIKAEDARFFAKPKGEAVLQEIMDSIVIDSGTVEAARATLSTIQESEGQQWTL